MCKCIVWYDIWMHIRTSNKFTGTSFFIRYFCTCATASFEYSWKKKWSEKQFKFCVQCYSSIQWLLSLKKFTSGCSNFKISFFLCAKYQPPLAMVNECLKANKFCNSMSDLPFIWNNDSRMPLRTFNTLKQKINHRWKQQREHHEAIRFVRKFKPKCFFFRPQTFIQLLHFKRNFF